MQAKHNPSEENCRKMKILYQYFMLPCVSTLVVVINSIFVHCSLLSLQIKFATELGNTPTYCTTFKENWELAEIIFIQQTFITYMMHKSQCLDKLENIYKYMYEESLWTL